MNLRQLDRKFLGRESEAEDLQVARAEGSYLYDARGRRYIDFLAGWCVGNFGWDNKEIKANAPRRRPDYVYPEYLYRPRKSGLLLTTSGNALTMFPALTLDRRTAKAGLDILEKSLG
jgi:4-aminobutyrate aminotransferase-like enzyme